MHVRKCLRTQHHLSTHSNHLTIYLHHHSNEYIYFSFHSVLHSNQPSRDGEVGANIPKIMVLFLVLIPIKKLPPHLVLLVLLRRRHQQQLPIQKNRKMRKRNHDMTISVCLCRIIMTTMEIYRRKFNDESWMVRARYRESWSCITTGGGITSLMCAC